MDWHRLVPAEQHSGPHFITSRYVSICNSIGMAFTLMLERSDTSVPWMLMSYFDGMLASEMMLRAQWWEWRHATPDSSWDCVDACKCSGWTGLAKQLLVLTKIWVQTNKQELYLAMGYNTYPPATTRQQAHATHGKFLSSTEVSSSCRQISSTNKIVSWCMPKLYMHFLGISQVVDFELTVRPDYFKVVLHALKIATSLGSLEPLCLVCRLSPLQGTYLSAVAYDAKAHCLQGNWLHSVLKACGIKELNSWSLFDPRWVATKRPCILKLVVASSVVLVV